MLRKSRVLLPVVALIGPGVVQVADAKDNKNSKVKMFTFSSGTKIELRFQLEEE